MTVTVEDKPEHHRYEAVDESGVVAGFAEYRRGDGRVELTHTVVDDAFEGQGVGSALARTALDAARSAGLRVTPTCEFMARWIDKHPDYADLVD
jgi:predicted GNAT family acetyltransferase